MTMLTTNSKAARYNTLWLQAWD